MALLAADLNDAEIIVVNDEKTLYHEPGFALLEDDNLITGAEAYANASLSPRRIQNRFWSQLHTEPLPDTRFQHLSAADLVSCQLEQIWQRVASPGDQLAIAVPAYMSHENLGLLLGIATELGIPVVAIFDAAVCALVFYRLWFLGFVFGPLHSFGGLVYVWGHFCHNINF
jgi:hypothetical protein